MKNSEFTKHIRGRLKAAGIKAMVRTSESGIDGGNVGQVRIDPPEFEARFTDEEQAMILRIVKCNGMTLVMGGEIDERQRTYGVGGVFCRGVQS